MSSEWDFEYAGFWDRFFADFVDGILLIVMVLPLYFVVDSWLLGLETGFLDDGTDWGFSDLAAWFWFLFNMTYLVGKRGQSWGRRVGTSW